MCIHWRGEICRAFFFAPRWARYFAFGWTWYICNTAEAAPRMANVALITGVTGQDGSYLAEFLLKKGYEVHGMVRRTSSFATGRIDHLRKGYAPGSEGLQLHYGDLGDGTGLRRIIEQVRPDEVYNLAAQSHVRISFDQPEYTADVVGLGALRLLEALRDHNKRRGRAAKLYQAGSSEMFGKVSRDSAERDHAVPSAQSLRVRQGLCALADGELSRSLRAVRVQRDSIQPRIAAGAAKTS